MSKKVLLVVPSAIVARGLEQIFNDLGEFEVCGILTDLSGGGEAQLRNMGADVVILDPSVFDHASRKSVRITLSEYTSAAVLAVVGTLWDDDSLKQYDGVLSLYDAPTTVIRKVRSALEGHTETTHNEGEELSFREKEILICVAKGMLNKEIADLYNISIHTVITHRKNITRKTGIKTVAGLTVYAILNNLIDMNTVE
jgi:DNA-binding NarL/FixJ family response regulator